MKSDELIRTKADDADWVEDMKGQLYAAFSKAALLRRQLEPGSQIPSGTESTYARELRDEIAYGTFLATAISAVSRPSGEEVPSTKRVMRQIWEDLDGEPKDHRFPSGPIRELPMRAERHTRSPTRAAIKH